MKYQELALSKKEVKQVMPEAVKFKYLYNGKELQDELELNVYDYGARTYDPAVPRFWQIDPLAEKYSFQSVYVYADDNPVRFMDIDGKGTEDTYKLTKKGKIVHVDNKKYYDKDGNEVDKIIAEESNESMMIEKNILNNTKRYRVERNKKFKYNLQVTNTSKSEKGVELFEFMARNIDNNKIEVAYARFNNGNNYVYTSHDKGTVRGTFIILRKERSNKLVIHFHSHPGDDPGPSPGDNQSVRCLKRRYKNLRNWIYLPIMNKYVPFDENTPYSELQTIEINFKKKK